MTIAFQRQNPASSDGFEHDAALQLVQLRQSFHEAPYRDLSLDVRECSEKNRKQQREKFLTESIDSDGVSEASGVWATVRTIAIGGVVGLLFAAGVFFAGSGDSAESQSPESVDTQISLLNNQ